MPPPTDDDKERIMAFRRRIAKYNLGSSFEIKGFLYKPKKKKKWVAAFLLIKLLGRKTEERQGLPEFSSHRLVHKVLDIGQFPTFLNELIRGKLITVGVIHVSPELMLCVFNYELKMRSYCQREYGIDEACLLLTTGGNPGDDLPEALKSFEIELRSETEYASSTSAIRQELGVDFGTRAYHPFIQILAPIEVKISKSEIKDHKFTFSLAASEKADLADIMVSLEGYDQHGKTTGFTRNIKEFDRVENQMNFHPVSIDISPYSLYVKLVLFFDSEIIEDFFLKNIEYRPTEISIQDTKPAVQEEVVPRKETIRAIYETALRMTNSYQKGKLLEQVVSSLIELVENLRVVGVRVDDGIQ